jgi:hypothetical protein
MRDMKTSWPLLLLIGATLLPSAYAGIDIGVTAEIRLGKALPPPPPEVVVVEEVGPPGPPPWAPGHVFRRNRTYYFYPECYVYYRPADRMWFYLEGTNWHAAATLPSHVTIDFGHSVSLTMETDRPYLYHQQVAARYPSGYFAKVKFRNHDDHHEANRSNRGKGRGKGKGRDRD